MKKTGSVLLIIALLFCLTACTTSSTKTPQVDSTPQTSQNPESLQSPQSTYNTLAEYLQFEKEDITQIAVGGCCSPDESTVITDRAGINAIYQKLDTTYRYVETTVIPIGALTVSFKAGDQAAGFGVYSDTKIYVSDPSRRSNVFVYELEDPSGIEYVKELVHPTSAPQTDPT